MFKNLPYKSIVSIIYLIVVTMETIDVTIVNVALPQIQTTLHAPVNLMGWITNGYVLSLATAIPLSSWLGERYGTKKILMFGIALFTMATIWCGLSTNIYSLIFARVFQGIGGGMLVPVGQTILFRSFEARELPSLLSKLSIPLTLAPALGQTLGGVIVEYLSWHWIFWVNIPFSVFCFWGTQKFLLESEKNKNNLDFIGLAICSLAIFVLFYSFSIIDFQATLSKPILFFILSCFLLSIFVAHEKRQHNPFFNLKVFSNKNFSLSVICGLIVSSNIMGTFFVSNFIFQETLKLTPLEAGLTAIPFSVGFLIAVKILPHIYPKKFGTRKILVYANMVGIIASLGMNFIYSRDQFNLLIILSFFRGIGFGFFVITLQAAGLAGIKKELMDDASSVLTLTRYAFMGFGTALFIVLTAIFMHAYKIYPISFAGNNDKTIQIFHWLYNIATMLMVIGFVFILKLNEDTSEQKQKEAGIVRID